MRDNNLPDTSAGALRDLVDLVIAKQSVDAGRAAPQLLCGCRAQKERTARCQEFALWARDVAPGYWTQQQIAEHLNDRGQTTSTGAAWSQASVSYLLRTAEGAR